MNIALRVSFCRKPRAPFRLDLTVWALRGRPNNAIDLGTVDFIDGSSPPTACQFRSQSDKRDHPRSAGLNTNTPASVSWAPSSPNIAASPFPNPGGYC
jgi:hypothetical protein